MGKMDTLRVGDFARLFGVTVDDFSPAVRAMMLSTDFRFFHLPASRQSEIVAMIQERLGEDTPILAPAGRGRQPRWQEGWSENLAEFKASGYDVRALVPKYYDRPGAPVRLFGQYIEPASNLFELNVRQVFCRWLFEKYLVNAPAIHEFGCGSGMNLATLAIMYPDKKLFGYDWAEASRDIISTMRTGCGWNVRGNIFDLFAPSARVDYTPSDALLAFHALEQVGGAFEPFIQSVLEHPCVCFVHVDGIEELYDPQVATDALALQFSRKRNYLSGYLTRLRELEGQGRIQLMRVQRVHFGNLYHDAYSYIVWRPL